MARVTDAHIEARKTQILDAAWNCFARNGYHGTTMQDVATEAGISAGAIYRYFDGKEAVLAAINERSQAMGITLVAAAAGPDGDPIRSIAVIGQAMMRFFHDPAFETIARINIEIWPEILRHDDLRRRVSGEIRFWREAVTKLLAEARSRGDLRPDVNPEAAAQVLMCAWEGMRHFRIVDDGFTPQSMVDLFRSLMSEQSPAREVPFDIAAPGPDIGLPHSMPAATPAASHNDGRQRRRRKE